MNIYRNSLYLLQIDTIYTYYLQTTAKIIKFDLKSNR